MKKNKLIDEALWPYFEYYNDGFTLKIDDQIVNASTNFLKDMYPKKAKTVEIEVPDEMKEILKQNNGILFIIIKKKEINYSSYI
jgi:hypothetical protein